MRKTYEGMFLQPSSDRDFEAASAPVRDVLARAEAEVLSMKPWDERRLAYEIKGHRRGLYVLAYFKADPARIAELHHEIQLNERILRAMTLSADHLSEEKIRAETPATLASARRAASEAERAARKAAEEKAAEQPTPQAKGTPKAPMPAGPETKAEPPPAAPASDAGEKTPPKTEPKADPPARKASQPDQQDEAQETQT